MDLLNVFLGRVISAYASLFLITFPTIDHFFKFEDLQRKEMIKFCEHDEESNRYALRIQAILKKTHGANLKILIYWQKKAMKNTRAPIFIEAGRTLVLGLGFSPDTF